MATIDWKTAAGGAWSKAANWAGHVVPGATDTAGINEPGDYTVVVSGAVTVGSLDLDAAQVTLAVEKSLSSTAIDLQSGTLLLAGGTIAGTLTGDGGILATSTTGTLDAVSLAGTISEISSGTLTIQDSLSVSGTASFTGATALRDVSGLASGTITFAGGFSLAGAPVFTVGAEADVQGIYLAASSGEQAIVNAGTLTNTSLADQSATGTALSLTNDGTISGDIVDCQFINHGLISGAGTFGGGFTNDGRAVVGANQTLLLTFGDVTAAGAGASILLDGGVIGLAGTLTAAQLAAFYRRQHIANTGGNGFGVFGLLQNAGDTLQIGTGTVFGTLSPGGDNTDTPTTISGGTVKDAGGEANAIVQLIGVEYESATPTLQLRSLSATNTTISGASTLYLGNEAGPGSNVTGGVLRGVGTVWSDSGLVLNGVDITGVHNSGAVTIDTSGPGSVEITASQNVTGYTFNAKIGATIAIDSGATIAGATFNMLALQDDLVFGNASGGAAVTLTASTIINCATAQNITALFAGAAGDVLVNQGSIAITVADTQLDIGQDIGGEGAQNVLDVINQGVITVGAGDVLGVDPNWGLLTNEGTIILDGGALETGGDGFVNHATLDVHDSTLVLIGTITVPQLIAMSETAAWSEVVVGSVLDLGGKSVTLGHGGLPDFIIENVAASVAAVNDGTLTIAAHSYLDAVGTHFTASLVNDGSIFTSVGSTDIGDTFAGGVSGHGTIVLSTGTQSSAFSHIAGAIGSGQKVMFTGHDTGLFFDNAAAVSAFAGTLAGFSAGDTLILPEDLAAASFVGDSIVATLTAGGTVSFATAGALHGSLRVSDDVITYIRGAASWPVPSLTDEAFWHGGPGR
jgi:hypothetical protein